MHTLETFHLILIIIIIFLFSPPIVWAAHCTMRQMTTTLDIIALRLLDQMPVTHLHQQGDGSSSSSRTIALHAVYSPVRNQKVEWVVVILTFVDLW